MAREQRAKVSVSLIPPGPNKVYTDESNVVNHLSPEAREIDVIRAKLIRAEQGGFSDLSAAQILAKAKEELRHHGEL